MKTRTARPVRLPRLANLLALGALALASVTATGCADTDVAAPDQRIEANIDDETLDLLMVTADLGPDDDYLIYEVVLPRAEGEYGVSSVENCPFGEPDPVESTCGYCACDDQGNAYCVDYSCAFGDDPMREHEPDPATQVTNPVLPLAGEAACADHDEGESWMQSCNICTCVEGQTLCTRQKCDAPGVEQR